MPGDILFQASGQGASGKPLYEKVDVKPGDKEQIEQDKGKEKNDAKRAD